MDSNTNQHNENFKSLPAETSQDLPNEILSALGKPVETDLTPLDIYKLASRILMWIALIFIAGMMSCLLKPDPGAIIFDVCKTVLPPIATLVIGYYFGERGKS